MAETLIQPGRIAIVGGGAAGMVSLPFSDSYSQADFPTSVAHPVLALHNDTDIGVPGVRSNTSQTPR